MRLECSGKRAKNTSFQQPKRKDLLGKDLDLDTDTNWIIFL